MHFISYSENDTCALAQNLAEAIKAPAVICLSGDLGAGKSVFCRAALRALTRNPLLDVPSPTFTLVQTYDSPAGDLYHFDMYRLETPSDVYELGIEDALFDGISLIEWPEKTGTALEDIAQHTPINITIKNRENGARDITIENAPDHFKLPDPAPRITRAMITAAGIGSRLRPYTDNCPKPLVPVQGKPIMDYAISALREHGVTDIAVNAHYKGDMVAAHLDTLQAPQFHLFHEDNLLDTGGGIKNMLPAMNNSPFFVLSGDMIWTDAAASALSRMESAWNSDTMDLMLLLFPVSKMDTPGSGDYHMGTDTSPDKAAPPVRARDKSGDYMWTSIRICHPRLFDGAPDSAFSFLALMDKAEREGRLSAIIHDGHWYHISTSADLEWIEKNAALKGVSA